MIADVTISVCRLSLAFENYRSTRVTVEVVSGDASWVTTRKTRLFSGFGGGGVAVCAPDCSIIFFPTHKTRATRYHWSLSVQQVTNIFSAAPSTLFQKTSLLVISEPAQICCVVPELKPVILGAGFKARRICSSQGVTGFCALGWINTVLAEKKLYVPVLFLKWKQQWFQIIGSEYYWNHVLQRNLNCSAIHRLKIQCKGTRYQEI